MGRFSVAEPRSPALDARNVSKLFGATLALDRASLTVAAGEVHALLGENGSGKSTLIKILSGYHLPEAGAQIEIAGRALRLPSSPGEAARRGVRFVHQELGLVGSLSVLENLRLDELAQRRGPVLRWSVERRRAAETLARHGLDVDLRTPVAALSPGDRAALAIVRATDGLDALLPAALLVLDEPTVFLSADRRGWLLTLVRNLTERGGSVLLVSHDLNEVSAIADRATVLRDGRVTGTVQTAEATSADLISLILGHDSPHADPRREVADAPHARVWVRGLSGTVVRDVSFEIGEGEIVGLAGRPGSGAEEVPRLVFGVERARSGRLELAGGDHDLTRIDPLHAVRAGIAYVPADRLEAGSVGNLSLAENLSLPQLRRFRSRLGLAHRPLRRFTQAALEQFAVRPAEPDRLVATLSGGNQQKALLAKWLATEPALLLLEEPTHGVDVGARGQLVALLRDAAQRHTSILCASSDDGELALLCDRVLVLRHGAVVAELAGADVTREIIARATLEAGAA